MSWKILFTYLILSVFAIFSILPLVICIFAAFKPLKEIYLTFPLSPPTIISFEGFNMALGALGRPLLNSVLFSIPATFLASFLGSMAAFAVKKVKIKGERTIHFFMVAGIFIPMQIVLIPLIVTLSGLGLYSSIPGLILAHTCYNIPMAFLLFAQFYDFIPESLVNAAKIDGATQWQIYSRVIMPLSGTPFVASATLLFTWIWNDYLVGLVSCASMEAMPATVALASMIGWRATSWNVLAAGGIIVGSAPLIIYLILAKYIAQAYLLKYQVK